jgi:hypothetical protein
MRFLTSYKSRGTPLVRSLTKLAFVLAAAAYLAAPASAQSSDDITVRARGVTGQEHINLRIGGTVVANWTLTTSLADYTYSGGATGDVQVQFDNDGGSRDVILDSVHVNGETREAEDMEYNTATYGNGECGGGSYSEAMHCSGVIGFGSTSDCLSGSCSGNNAGSLAVAVRARGTTGEEHINLLIGGAVVSNWTLTTGYQDYTYSGDALGEVQVEFDNDSGSRDAQVDYVTVNGETRQAEDMASNTGVYNGSCGGGSYSEMLHCNGAISFGSVDATTPTDPGDGSGSNGAEFTGANCPIPSLPSPGAVGDNGQALPDPFASIDGDRISQKSQWRCQRAEIKAMVEAYEMGRKPSPPDSVTGSAGGGGITVTVQDNGGSISFSAGISTPAGSGPFPAIIAIGSNNLNTSIINELGIATITFNNNEMGAQSGSGSRGQGKFFDLYGTQYTDSSIMAWAWGVSRLIDALEATPAANIDASRLAVTGCSRNGKGALYAGAFDERIDLTIPQESGAGGTASWRVSEYLSSQGQNIQTASSAHGEQPWFDTVFGNFTGSRVNNLPFDHHMVMGMIAPRGLLTIDNPIDWLGPESTQTAGVAAKEIWKALGVDANMGVSQTSSQHTHCQFPSSQNAELRNFLNKFLKDVNSGDTNVMKGPSVNRSQWIQWSTPSLQ